jgi:hypothetical protein
MRVVWYVFDQRFSPSRVMKLTISPHVMAAFFKLCSAIPWSSVCCEQVLCEWILMTATFPRLAFTNNSVSYSQAARSLLENVLYHPDCQ